MNTIRIILFSSILLTSSGCVGVMLAGAAASGVVISDNRSFHVMNEDFRIGNEVREALRKEKALNNSHIVATSFNQAVFLGGQTTKASYRYLAEKVARKVTGVKRIYNEIAIAEPTDLERRAKDSWLSMRVKTMMLARKGLNSASIKVVTEDGVVYLMGRVDHSQANLATDVARRIEGVKRVVKIFQYQD